jgi:predicted MPP superfamily phosphohydrolase
MPLFKSKKRIALVVCGALLLCCLTLILWAFVIEPDRLVVNEVALNFPNWPKAFASLKVVVVSDLHVGAPHIDTAKLRQVVSTINAQNPDLILLAGDFVIQDVLGGQFVEPEVMANDLKNLRARFGVFAVLGNHDWWYDGERVMRALDGVGIRVLENGVVRIQQDGQSLWLVGLADLWTQTPDIEGTLRQVSDDGPVIVLTHNPDIFPQIPSRVILTVAGHTHGGQVNLPLLGRRIVPSNYKDRYAIGHIQEADRHLFVTPGVGTSIIPVRFRVPPEISILTLNGLRE